MSASPPQELDRIPGEQDRAAVDLVHREDGLWMQPANGALQPLPRRQVHLRLELLRVKLEGLGPEGEVELRFATHDAARVEAAARQGAESLEMSYSLAGFLLRELRVLLDEDDAAELLRGAMPELPAAALAPLVRTRRRLAGWACLWGLALPLLLSALGLWWVLRPDPTNPFSWAVGSLLAFAGFNVLATAGLYVQGATQGWLLGETER